MRYPGFQNVQNFHHELEDPYVAGKGIGLVNLHDQKNDLSTERLGFLQKQFDVLQIERLRKATCVQQARLPLEMVVSSLREFSRLESRDC